MFKYKSLTLLLTLALSWMLFQPSANADAARNSKVVLTVMTSPESNMKTDLAIMNSDSIEKMIQKAERTHAAYIPITDTFLTVQSKGIESAYALDQEGDLYEAKTREKLEIRDSMKGKLLKYADRARLEHYGKLTEWDIAKDIIPKKAKFTVIDLETGLSFQVQRRAGNKHADVQPLTKEDTAVMKQIYNGKWSWDRRAILVKADHHQLAASMHGMPHGGDGIPDNNFSGHFCIHFLGSSTHGKGNIDPEHQFMVRKAAGVLDDFLIAATPYQVMETFVLSYEMKQAQFMRMSFFDPNSSQLQNFLKDMHGITGIRKKFNYNEKDFSNSLTMDIPIELGIFRQGQRERRLMFTFQMKRETLSKPWKIDSIGVVPLLNEDEDHDIYL